MLVSGGMMQLVRAIVTIAMSLTLIPPTWAQMTASSSVEQRARRDQDDIVVTGQRRETSAKWVRAESSNFTVYGRDEVQVRQVAATLERFHQLLELLTRTPSPEQANPLSVYLLFGASQIEQLRRAHATPGLIFTGYYSAAPTGMLLAADMRWDSLRDRIPRYHEVWLFTEYTRHFLVQNARSAYLPSWYVDGLSMYLATTRFTGDTVEYGKAHPNLAGMLDNLRWEPIGKIISGELDHGQLYSAESALVVHYIFAKPARVSAFERFLAATRSGAQPVPAFEAAFGIRMQKLQARLWQYRYESTYVRASTSGFATPDITVSKLPRSADALLLDQAAMRIGISEPDRQRAVLRRAEDAVADRSDEFAQRVLAQAQVLYGVPEQANAALDALLASAPADPELLYLKGMQHLTIARRGAVTARTEYEEARKWFARAYRSDPEYYPALFAWAESLSPEPRLVSENTLNVLWKAALLAPQATQIRVTTANMLMLDGRFEDAEMLLARIVVSPRDPVSEQVPALLAQARAHAPVNKAQLMASFRYIANWKDLNCC